jgi:hypothetical protein
MIGMWAVLALALVQTPDPKPIAAVAAGGPAQTGGETALLLVDREADDDAQGSLRWAVTTSNAEPGRYRIEIAASRIVLKSALPAIKGTCLDRGPGLRALGRSQRRRRLWLPAARSEVLPRHGAGPVRDQCPHRQQPRLRPGRHQGRDA